MIPPPMITTSARAGSTSSERTGSTRGAIWSIAPWPGALSLWGAGTAREPGNHEYRPALPGHPPVFMGSGPGPVGHPGMTPEHAQSIAACTRLATRSRRKECQGSGDMKFVMYVKDTPLVGSAHEYEVPAPPCPI